MVSVTSLAPRPSISKIPQWATEWPKPSSAKQLVKQKPAKWRAAKMWTSSGVTPLTATPRKAAKWRGVCKLSIEEVGAQPLPCSTGAPSTPSPTPAANCLAPIVLNAQNLSLLTNLNTSLQLGPNAIAALLQANLAALYALAPALTQSKPVAAVQEKPQAGEIREGLKGAANEAANVLKMLATASQGIGDDSEDISEGASIDGDSELQPYPALLQLAQCGAALARS